MFAYMSAYFTAKWNFFDRINSLRNKSIFLGCKLNQFLHYFSYAVLYNFFDSSKCSTYIGKIISHWGLLRFLVAISITISSPAK